MTNLSELLSTACHQLFNLPIEPILSRPEEQFGDFSTNLAMQLAGQLKQPPQQIAKQLKKYLDEQADDTIAKVEVVKPGFLNIFLTDQALWQATQSKSSQNRAGKRVLLEYSCPNPFKELHTGHLYQTIVGDSIGVMIKSDGATVYRANFGGDVGLHVAKSLWGLVQKLAGEHPDKLAKVAQADQAQWLSQAYVAGAKAYEDDPAAAEQIKQYNSAVY
ncbi:MAG: arginine--tRNA ligase, partial [Candidatus Saccharimonadales bacterium]